MQCWDIGKRGRLPAGHGMRAGRLAPGVPDPELGAHSASFACLSGLALLSVTLLEKFALKNLTQGIVGLDLCLLMLRFRVLYQHQACVEKRHVGLQTRNTLFFRQSHLILPPQ